MNHLKIKLDKDESKGENPNNSTNKEIKSLGINLTRNVQNLCEENITSILNDAKVNENK